MEAPKEGDNFFKMHKVVQDKFKNSTDVLLMRILKVLAACLRNEGASEEFASKKINLKHVVRNFKNRENKQMIL